MILILAQGWSRKVQGCDDFSLGTSHACIFTPVSPLEWPAWVFAGQGTGRVHPVGIGVSGCIRALLGIKIILYMRIYPIITLIYLATRIRKPLFRK